MTKLNAAAIYAANMSEMREGFSKRVAALQAEYMNTDMCITQYDRKMEAMENEFNMYKEQEVKLYHLNSLAEKGEG